QSRKAVGALEELVAEARVPARRHPAQVRNGLQPVARGVGGAHQDRERVVEPERREPAQVELPAVLARDLAIHAVAVGDGRVLEHRGERRARVLDVQIDLPRQDGLMTHERAAQVQAPLHRDVHPALDLLRHDLGQEIGFREVFRADDDAVVPGTGAEQRHQGEEHPAGYRCHASLRSAIPSTASAARASSAAGNAPAMISVSSTVATPRKMYTPSPPAPIAAPIVATPTPTTVATRMPARITPAAS